MRDAVRHAVVQHGEASELVSCRVDQLGQADERVTTLPWRPCAPRLERGARRVDRVVDIGRAGERHRPLHLTGRRVHMLVSPALAVGAPLVADVEMNDGDRAIDRQCGLLSCRPTRL